MANKTAAQKAKEREDARLDQETEDQQAGSDTQEGAQDTDSQVIEGNEADDGDAVGGVQLDDTPEPVPTPAVQKTLNVTNDGGATSYCIGAADLKTWSDAGYVVKK